METGRGWGGDAKKTHASRAETKAISRDESNVGSCFKGTIGMEMSTTVSSGDLGAAIEMCAGSMVVVTLKGVHLVFDRVMRREDGG